MSGISTHLSMSRSNPNVSALQTVLLCSEQERDRKVKVERERTGPGRWPRAHTTARVPMAEGTEEGPA